MNHECLRVADVREVRGELHRLNDPLARLLPAALLTRVAAVLASIGFDDVERASDPESGPYLAAADDEGAMLVVSVRDLGVELSDRLPLRAAADPAAAAAFANACNGWAHAARFVAIDDGLHADATYAGGFEPRSFARFAEAFRDDVWAAWESDEEAAADGATPLLDVDAAFGPPEDGADDAAAAAEAGAAEAGVAEAGAPAPGRPAAPRGTGRLARIPRSDAP